MAAAWARASSTDPGQREAERRRCRRCGRARWAAPPPSTAASAASSNRPRRTSAMARAPSMPNSSGSNGLRWREWSDAETAAAGVAALRLHEGERVVAEREVRAEVDGLLQFRDGLGRDGRAATARGPCAQCAAGSRSSTSSAVRRRRRWRGSISGSRSAQPWKAFCQCVNDRPAWARAKVGIERDRLREEVPRLLVVGAREAVHVPQAAVMRLPRVERARRLQDGAVALERLDLAGDRRDDAVADLVEHLQRVVAAAGRRLSAHTMRAVRVSASSTVTARRSPRRCTEPLTT